MWYVNDVYTIIILIIYEAEFILSLFRYVLYNVVDGYFWFDLIYYSDLEEMNNQDPLLDNSMPNR